MEADDILKLVISCESFTQQTTDDSHELLSLIFSEAYEIIKNVVCRSCNWRFDD